MKNEFDQIKITNAGKCSEYSEHIRAYDNDNPRYIKENPLSSQKETYQVKEFSDEVTPQVVKESSKKEEASVDLQDVSQGASSVMSSMASSIGSGISALAGVVATSVVAAVVVVVAFVSTLAINLSLVMSDTNSLVFEVEMRGAQEEDFEDPIYAILTGDDGTYIEQELSLDNVYLKYDNLTPGKEYIIKIKNSEKVFVEKSYCTAKEKIERGQIFTQSTGKMVSVSVKDVQLNQGEYYTLEVKDELGNVVFSVDSVNATAEYTFEVASEQRLYCSLAISGRSYAMSQIEIKEQPEYDLDNPVWEWQDSTIAAKVRFASLDGGEDLIVDAIVSKTDEVAATCEDDGYILYTATATVEDKEFQTTTTEMLPAFGHSYVFDSFEWDDNFVAKAVYKCAHDETHVEYFNAEMSEQISSQPNCLEPGQKTHIAVYDGHRAIKIETLPKTDHIYGELQETEATCTTDGMAPHYHCSFCGAYFDENKEETTEEALVIEGGHDIEYVEAGYDSTKEMDFVAHSYCTKCGTYYNLAGEEVTLSEIGTPNLSYNNSTQSITIYADGYKRSNGEFVPFVSSSTNRYYITGKYTSADQSLTIRSKNYDGSTPTGDVKIYITMEDLEIIGREWASAIYVISNNSLTIDINNIGTTTIKGYNHPAFACSDSTYPVIINVTSSGGFTNFVCGRQYQSSPTLYGGTVTFTMNGSVVDENGQ